MTTIDTTVTETVVSLPLAALAPHPDNVRTQLGDLTDLTRSIKANGVLIPLLARLRINPVLGFLAFGTLIGPYGLASYAPQWPWLSWLTFARPEDVEFLAELGVIFLMFMIGLDMSMQRLWSMRRKASARRSRTRSSGTRRRMMSRR